MGPVKDWPLALCSTRTIKPDQDFEPCDLVYPDYVVENRQVYHSNDLDWFYASDQLPHEAWVFLQSDTDHSTRPGMSWLLLVPLDHADLFRWESRAYCIPRRRCRSNQRPTSGEYRGSSIGILWRIRRGMRVAHRVRITSVMRT